MSERLVVTIQRARAKALVDGKPTGLAALALDDLQAAVDAPRNDGETCSHCQAPVGAFTHSFWRACDELWERVTKLPSEDCDLILCPRCFTDLARTFGISIRWEAVVDG